jgi:preprotein translocase subunit SecA
VAEAEDGETPATPASIDRARASAHNSMRRLLNDLRQFQSDRWLRAEVLRDGFDEAYIGIADAHRVIKGLTANERLKGDSLMAQVGQALSPGKQSTSPVPQPLTPRNAPCPCQSGLKYKRCCGAAAPPVLTVSRRLVD